MYWEILKVNHSEICKVELKLIKLLFLNLFYLRNIIHGIKEAVRQRQRFSHQLTGYPQLILD